MPELLGAAESDPKSESVEKTGNTKKETEVSPKIN